MNGLPPFKDLSRQDLHKQEVVSRKDSPLDGLSVLQNVDDGGFQGRWRVLALVARLPAKRSSSYKSLFCHLPQRALCRSCHLSLLSASAVRFALGTMRPLEELEVRSCLWSLLSSTWNSSVEQLDSS